MRAWRDRHVVAGCRGGASPRWRPVAAVAAAGALPLVCGAAAQPASAAGGYAVTATIAVGAGPDGVAVDPTAHTVYVTNVEDDTVSVIDETTGSVTAAIKVGGGPLTVAADLATHTAYVTNGGNGTVSVIDGATDAVTGIITVGSGPDGVAVDPATHTVYVANGGSGTVSVIDGATDAVTGIITVGSGPDGVAVDPATHTVYVANGGTDTVSVIDETTRAVTATIAVGANPSAVAVDPTTHTAYAANLTGSVSVIDETTGTVTATVAVGSDPSGAAADPTTHTAYVPNYGNGTVSVISVTQPTPITTVTSSRNPSSFGQDVTFTATVDPADGGTMTFSSGSEALCRAVPLAEVSGRTYRATCTTSTLPGGLDTITAAYSGDASYAASTGTLTQTVTRVPTALTVRIGRCPHPFVTVIATLTASGRQLSGQPVSFSTGHTDLCTRLTSGRGVAACVLTGPQTCLAEQDNDILRVSYPGSTSYQPSSATAALRHRYRRPGWPPPWRPGHHAPRPASSDCEI